MDEIFIDSKEEAAGIVTSLSHLVGQHGFATVSDYYRLLGLNVPNHVDGRLGWKKLDRVDIQQIGVFYQLDLPEPTIVP